MAALAAAEGAAAVSGALAAAEGVAAASEVLAVEAAEAEAIQRTETHQYQVG
mgnify:CR=1 FL=1